MRVGATPTSLPVTVENFARAESDGYFSVVVKDGGFGRFHHNRELTRIDRQVVVRSNRDTLYSAAVFDLEQVHALQNAIGVEATSVGAFQVPQWDASSQQTVRNALLVLGRTLSVTKRMFGRREHVDPVRHLIGTAMAWGGNPEKDALYNVTAKRDANGAVTIRFGGADGRAPNHLPISPGWNYTVRLYRPRQELLDGTWHFPDAQPIAGPDVVYLGPIE